MSHKLKCLVSSTLQANIAVYFNVINLGPSPGSSDVSCEALVKVQAAGAPLAWWLGSWSAHSGAGAGRDWRGNQAPSVYLNKDTNKVDWVLALTEQWWVLTLYRENKYLYRAHCWHLLVIVCWLSSKWSQVFKCGVEEIDELMEVTICRLTVLMATLRSGKKLDSNDNNNETAEEKGKGQVVKDRTTLVVFFGLLIDLLGKL